MKKKTLVFIVGETGSGKDTVANKLPHPKVVSYTTRAMRDSDMDGKNHWFISEAGMDKLEERDDLIAYTKTGDVRYCAKADQLNRGVNIYIINPDGVRWFRENYKKDDLNVIIIGLYVPLGERIKRCSTRSDFETSFAKRVTAEQNDFNRFRLDGEFDYLIKNNDSDKTADIIFDIIQKDLLYSVFED